MALTRYNQPRIVTGPIRPRETGTTDTTGTTVGRPSADVMEARILRGQPATPLGGTTPAGQDPYGDLISPFDWSSLTSGWFTAPGSTSSSALTAAQKLADKRGQQGATAQQAYFNQLLSGVGGEYNTLRQNVGTVYAPARTAAEQSYQTALAALGGRRTQAETLAGQGRTALGEYLAANTPRAYAGLPQAQAPTLSPNTVAQYAAAIGAPTTAIGQAAAQAAVEAQAAGGGYNRLLDVLRAAEASGQASRLAELQMLGNVQGAGIEQLYGTGAQQLEAARQAALSQIAQQEAQARFGIEQAEVARRQALQQALAQIYGTGYLTGP